YQIISKLSHLRQNNSTLGYGDTTELWINEDVYIYERKFGNNVVVTAVNSGDTDYTITNMETSLPGGTYSDVLEGLLGGNSLSINENGAVNEFVLGSNEVAVREKTETSRETKIEHIGTISGQHVNEITING